MGDHENQSLPERIHRLGEHPVDGHLAARHLTAMMTLPPSPRASRRTRVKVAAAFATGLVLGGTSLASAGALGDGVQRTVADTVDGVGIDLPGGTIRSTDGCEGSAVRNHGQFVSDGGDPHSDCGKPVASQGETSETQPPDGAAAPDGTGCRPPWAGRGNQAERTAEARAAHEAACGEEADADPVEPVDPGAAGRGPQGDEDPKTKGKANAGAPASGGAGGEEEKANGKGAPKESTPAPEVSGPPEVPAEQPAPSDPTEADPPVVEEVPRPAGQTSPPHAAGEVPLPSSGESDPAEEVVPRAESASPAAVD